MNNANYLDVPVLFLMFNRPDLSVQVFAKIREVQPKALYVALDGPRGTHPLDAERVSQCLAILKGVDWPCEVKTLVRQKNLGCGLAVSSAISWFFEQEPMGIILEDDCVPDASFFSFCRELLYRYEHHTEVMHIGGVNFQNGKQRGEGSYYFTKICHVWGWASWRRAWKLYDADMTSFPKFKKSKAIDDLFIKKKDRKYWLKNFEMVHSWKISSWAFPWTYSIWINNGLCILPNVNLVMNIGFDERATHTQSKDYMHNEIKAGQLLELEHPSFIIECAEATEYALRNQFSNPNIWVLRYRRFKKILNEFFN
ncbi:nucleotide-diphospho-sugar transferase [Siphonobacter sp. SORGH_AS_0500]|uniref:nucleotide-diphospho-sugar transferase n=1 Tax=Siphonobacter sp. SORGH_AS_0500 TaxID=1864824 RepID=UPI0028623D4A|nr:nucleotide-diphospho-sugar transferase [Siphonobacter sp. SORGH_AS_0500]MDR6193704.1 hypothetical protein [Siphonobacter sp. SORGH_AS_0500]